MSTHQTPGGETERLLKRFKNAQRRTLYWSGNPSFSVNRAKASHSGRMDERYELAMCDQKSLAGLLLDLDVKVTVRDYKAEFRAKFSKLFNRPPNP